MRSISAILTLIFLFVPTAWGSILAVDKIQGEQALLPYISWLADPAGEYGIDDMTRPELQVEFKPLGHGVPLIAKGPVWLRLVLRKSAPEAGGLRSGDTKLAMCLGELPPGNAELYIFERGGPVAGVSGWIKEPLVPHSLSPLPDPGLTPLDVYIRMDNPPGLWFAPTVSPQEQLSPSILPPDLLLPGLLLLGLAVCLLRAAGDRAAWAFWASLLLVCVLAQSLLPLPGERAGFSLWDLPALLAPGMALLLLPQVGRCMFAASSLSGLSSGILFFFSLLGAALCLAPLVPGLGWISRLFPVWPLLLAPLLPLCLGFLAARRPGSLAFAGICFLSVIGAGIALFAVVQPNLHPLAPQAALWGLAVGGLGFALVRAPKTDPAGDEREPGLDIPADGQIRENNPGMALALSAVELAKAHGGLKIADSALFSSKSQYDELPGLSVSRVEPDKPATLHATKTGGADTLSVHDIFAREGSFTEAPAIQTASSQVPEEAGNSPASAPAFHTAAPALEEAFSMPVAADYATPKLFVILEDLPNDGAFSDKQGHMKTSAPAAGTPPIPESTTAEATHEGSKLHHATEPAVEAENYFTPAALPVDGPGQQLPYTEVLDTPLPVPEAAAPEAADSESAIPARAPLEDDYTPPRLFVIPDIIPNEEPGLEHNSGKAPLPGTETPPAAGSVTAQEAASDVAAEAASRARVISLLDDNDFSGYSEYAPASSENPDDYPSALLEELREDALRRISLPSSSGASSFVFDLGALVREIHESVVPLAKHKGLIFSWYADPSLPVLLEGDSPSLRQALTLLLQSAVQVTGRGTVQLAIKRAAQPSSSPSGLQYLLFTIKDSGAAQRTDAGFFHAWELASRTGGSFVADYSPSQGTEITFSVGFTLPSDEMAGRHQEMQARQQETTIDEPAALSTHAAFLQGQIDTHALEERAEAEGIHIPAITPASGAEIEPATGTAVQVPFNRRDPEVARILVTDMTTSNRRLLVNYLSDLPHEHVEVPSTPDLPALLRENPASLVIFDADMPEGELLETIRTLRGQEALYSHSPIPLLVLVSHDAQHARMMQAGASAVLHKPFSKQALEQEVRKWLGLEPVQHAGQEDTPQPESPEYTSRDSYAQALLDGRTSNRRETGSEAKLAPDTRPASEDAGASEPAHMPAPEPEISPAADIAANAGTEQVLPGKAPDQLTESAPMEAQEPASMPGPSEAPPEPAARAAEDVDILAAALRDAALPPAGAVREVPLPPVHAATGTARQEQRDMDAMEIRPQAGTDGGASPEGSAQDTEHQISDEAARGEEATNAPRQAAPMLLGLSPEDVTPQNAPGQAPAMQAEEEAKQDTVPPDVRPGRQAEVPEPQPVEQPASVKPDSRASGNDAGEPASTLLDLAIFGDEEAQTAAPEAPGTAQEKSSHAEEEAREQPDKPAPRKIRISVKKNSGAKAVEAEKKAAPQKGETVPVPSEESWASTSATDVERGVADDTVAPAALSNELFTETPEKTASPAASAFEQDAGVTYTPSPPAEDDSVHSAFDRDAGVTSTAPAQEEYVEAGPDNQMLVPLPGMGGEAVELVSLPLLPGVIHALRDALEDAFQGKEQAQTLLIQEATSRLAGKAEIFHLDKLSKISRCVERAAEADDLEAAVTLLDDLSVVTLRYINSLEECYQDFLSMNR